MSFTNEGYDLHAYRQLESWINIRYPNATSSISTTQNLTVYELHDHLLHRFKDAALQIIGESLISDDAADLQVGLGVLYYNSGEFESAVEHFTLALNHRPRVGWCSFCDCGVGLSTVESAWGNACKLWPVRRCD